MIETKNRGGDSQGGTQKSREPRVYATPACSRIYTEAGISDITNDTTEKSQKQLKIGEDSITTTMNIDNSATSLEKETQTNTKSILSNYNPVKKFSAAQHHDILTTTNPTNIE